jgi:glyoxalase family protein
MRSIPGIHHVTAIAGDPQANVDFYHSVLGQRMVKTTVNFDDPGTYHFYYGDREGTPGTIMTFFPWPGARRGVPGNGEIGAVAYSIAASSLDYWQDRLASHDVPLGQLQSRFGSTVLPFRDPDGMALEFVVDEAQGHRVWLDGPIPVQHVLRGFFGVTLWVRQAEPTVHLLTEEMGYHVVGQEGARWRLAGDPEAAGHYVDLLVRPDLPRGQMGAGSVHHVAFRTRDDAEQLAYQQRLRDAGYQVTPVRDRQYFHSIYFREPGGVLFEIATDPPGFTLDETVSGLGSALKLPRWLEPQRREIEASLPSISIQPVHIGSIRA